MVHLTNISCLALFSTSRSWLADDRSSSVWADATRSWAKISSTSCAWEISAVKRFSATALLVFLSALALMVWTGWWTKSLSPWIPSSGGWLSKRYGISVGFGDGARVTPSAGSVTVILLLSICRISFAFSFSRALFDTCSIKVGSAWLEASVVCRTRWLASSSPESDSTAALSREESMSLVIDGPPNMLVLRCGSWMRTRWCGYYNLPKKQAQCWACVVDGTSLSGGRWCCCIIVLSVYLGI